MSFIDLLVVDADGSTLHFNSIDVKVFAESFSNFSIKSNLYQHEVNSENKESNRKKPALHIKYALNRYLI